MRVIIKNALLILAGLTLTAAAAPDTKRLQITDLGKGLTCIKDSADYGSANSFYIKNENRSVLVDAGWPDEVEPADELLKTSENAVKVATHFHSDHIVQWHRMGNIFLTENQAGFCKNDFCAPSRWQTIRGAKPFAVSGLAVYEKPIDGSNSQFIAIQCDGHSPTDACFLDKDSRTLFVGDLFYFGPVFYFLPGGDIQRAANSLNALLRRTDWDRVALTHGECSATRADLEAFAADLRQIISRKLHWTFNFNFWLPLRAYKVKTGFVLTNLMM